MPTMQIDNPLTRDTLTCPLCNREKSRGAVACWPCYKYHEMKYGNRYAEEKITRFERMLERSQQPKG